MSSFSEACGTCGPLELELQPQGSDDVQIRRFDQPFVVIGRDAHSDLILYDKHVSKRHAYLQVIAGRVLCIDLDSRGGLHWEGGRAPWGWLGRQRGIDIGAFRIRLGPTKLEGTAGSDWPADLNDPLSSRPVVHERLPGLVVEASGLLGEATSWSMRNVLGLIGRSVDCRVRLDHSSVSRFHAALLRTPTGSWVIDLLGSGGISLNGQRVRHAPVGEGDELQVGSSRLKFRVLPPGETGDGGGAKTAGTFSYSSLQDVALTSTTLAVNLPDLQPGEEAEFATAVPAHFVQHFDLLQKTMFYQFQQTMMMMAEWLSTQHGEQMAEVRLELAELRRLNQDLCALQDEMNARTSDEPLSHGKPLRLPRVSHPAPSCEVESGIPKIVPTGQSSPISTPIAARKPRADRGASGVSVAEIHEKLAGRIAALQGEQQGRWQRLLGLVKKNP